jgi:hypothetical protein
MRSDIKNRPPPHSRHVETLLNIQNRQLEPIAVLSTSALTDTKRLK